MTTFQSFKAISRCAIFPASYLSLSILAQAVAPDAVTDSLVVPPVIQNLTKVILEATLISNDLGDDKAIGAAGPTSVLGAAVSWDDITKQVTYDPTAATILLALDLGSSATDSFSYQLGGSDGPDDTGTVVVLVSGVNDPPTITGFSTGTLNTDDDDPMNTPFSGVVIGDPDTGEIVLVRVTMTVPVDSPAVGEFNNLNGFADLGGGVYQYLGTVSNATSILAGLNFLPDEDSFFPNTDKSTLVTVEVDDGTATPVTASRTINVTSINDNPILSPGAAIAFNLVGGATNTPFSGITLDDDDFEDLTPPDPLPQPPPVLGSDFTATITLGELNDGSIFSLNYGWVLNAPGIYSFTGKTLEVTQAIQTAEYFAPSSAGDFVITLVVVDSDSGISNPIVATATVSQPTPGLSGLVAGQQLLDSGVIFPFAAAIFNNFGPSSRLIEITLDSDAKGSFDVLGGFTKSGGSAPFVYSVTGSGVVTTDAIRNLRFKPAPDRITGASEAVVFNIEVKTSDGSLVLLDAPPLTVTVIPFNNAPIISSNSPQFLIDDDGVVSPFETMSMTDVDEGGGQDLVVTVTLIGEDPNTNAALAGGGVLALAVGAPPVAGVTISNTGTEPAISYIFSGQPDAVTSYLNALVFTPTPNRNAVGEVETITFTVAVEDGTGGADQSGSTKVVVTSVNGAPVIVGIPALSEQPFPMPASGNGMTVPFAVLELVDEEDLTFSIILDDAGKGTLSGTDFATSDGGVTYVYTGVDESPAAITLALQALTYTFTPGFGFPPNQPGLTTFTLVAEDSTNVTSEPFTLYVRERNVAHIVNSTGDTGPGSLREAVGFAGNGDMIVFDFPVADFPATILLQSTLIISKNLSIVGSGVDQLTISGGDAAGLFSIINAAEFTVEQLSLRDGNASSYGGAIAVGAGSKLVVRHCEFQGNHAGQYGGAIDVFEGELIVEHSLFHQNSVIGSEAKGGGAISIFSTGDSSITNTSFVGNQQENGGGYGGGALYAEIADLASSFDLHVEHCTFSDNIDAATSGSAILSTSAGLEVVVRNNIFSDSAGLSGVVLDVLGGGRFDSLGGNIATDSTDTTYTQSGSQLVTLLNHFSDRPSSDPMLDSLADNEGSTRTCALLAGSPAIDTSIAVSPVSDALGTDQRGVWRGGSVSDVGAFESGAFQRLNINELLVEFGASVDFIEFYNPRTSDDLDMVGLTLWVDGVMEHTFTGPALTPGSGVAWFSPVDLDPEKGSIIVKNANEQKILEVDYVATFAEDGLEVVTTGQSINRYPLYEGGFLPHQQVVENVTELPSVPGTNLTSPGDDVNGSALGGGNAPPIAVADVDENLDPIFVIFANELFDPDVLLNDIEFDRTDIIKITEVMPMVGGDADSAELLAVDAVGVISLLNLPTGIDTTIAPLGATVTIDGDQLGLRYDPTNSPTMISLRQGETVTDIWAYTIRDFDGTGAEHDRGPVPVDALKEAANITKATSYFTVSVTGVNEAPTPVDDAIATLENQAIRVLADFTLLSPAVFNFGDLDVDFQDFDAMGAPVTLKPAPPTTALLTNDDDVDNDDTSASLLLVAVHTTAAAGDLEVTTSELGATVTLDIRTKREETSIVYDPRSSSILNKLSAGEVATDCFYYSVFDKYGARGVAKVTVTVTGVNDVPMATDDGGFVAIEDEEFMILGADLLANDTDPDQDMSGPDDAPTILTPFDINSALGADLVFDGTTITYDPRTIDVYESLARNETITDTLSYTITDMMGGTSQATVTIVVEGRNDAPVATDDLLEILENQTTVVAAANGLLFNDNDVDINGTPPDDDPWVLAQRDFITPLGAGLNINPDGSYRYDANSPAIDSLIENELAVEVFPYTVIDNFRTTASDDVFKVLANRAGVVLPVLLNDAVVGSLATAVAGYAEDVSDPDRLIIQSANHSLRDGLLIRIEGYSGLGTYNGVYPVTSIDRDHFSLPVPFVDDPAGTRGTWLPWFTISAGTEPDQGGSLSVVRSLASDVIGYSGDPAEEGKLIIESPGHGLQDGLLVLIEGYQGAGAYNGIHGITRIDDDTFSVNVPYEDDPAGTRGTWRPGFAVTADPVLYQARSLLIGEERILVYTPAVGFYGEETFTYAIEDGVGGQDVGAVSLEVILPPFNGFVSASEDRFRIGMGESAVVVDVLANDNTLPSGGSALTIFGPTAVGAATGLLEVVNGGQSLRYTPPGPTFTGVESFNYSVEGGGTDAATTTVTFDVVDRTDLLSGSDDDYVVVTGSIDNSLNVLANDPSLPDFPVSSSLVSIGTASSGGTASIVGETISYTPPGSPFIGTDTFTYTSRDASGATTTQMVKVQVVPDDVDFYAKSDHYVVVAGSAPLLLPVLLNDGAVQNETAILSVVNLGLDTDSPPDVSRVAIMGGNTVQYTPPLIAGTEDFNYEISIGTIERREAKITITVVNSFETVPEPENDFFRVAKNSGPHSLDVLLNDAPYPVAGWAWTITGNTVGDQGGTVAIEGGGATLSYIPLAGFFGTETFTYTISDSFGDSEVATVSIMVGELITAPDFFAVLENSVANPLGVLANDDLLDTFAPDYTISAVDPTSAGGGLLSVEGLGPDNYLLYTPDPGFVGEDTFSYIVVDQTGETRDETATVLVLPTGSDRDEAELRVEITGVNDIPMLTGTSNGAIDDKNSISPFAAVSITDLDAGGNQLQTIVVSFDSSFGSVVAPGMAMTSSGVWQIVGTPAAVTAALNTFHFTPYENFIDYINPGQADVVFTLSIDDAYIATPIIDATTVTVTPINDAPIVFNPIPDQILQVNAFPRGFYLPQHFSDVDDDVEGGQLTWTVTGNTNSVIFDSVTVDPVSRFLVLDFATDQAGISDITVSGTDRGQLTVETTFRVTVEGHPIVVLEAGETQPPTAVYVPGSASGFRRDYTQSFRISNEGTLPVDAFIVHVSDLDQPVDGISIDAATFSTNENGTLTDFTDDTTSAAGVSILEVSTYVYAVNYDVPIPPGGSVVVHLTYRVSSVGLISIRPTIEVELSTTARTGAAGISKVEMDADGIMHLTLNVLAGRAYRLDYSSDLLNWNPWAAPIPVSLFDREIEVIDDGLNTGVSPSRTPSRQYRLVDVTDS